MLRCLFFFITSLLVSTAAADTIDQPPPRLAIIIDQSRSMVAPLPHSVGLASSRQVRESISSGIAAWHGSLEINLWVQNPDGSPECAVKEVGARLNSEAAVDAIHSTRVTQRGIGFDNFRNPVAEALIAASVGVDGVILFADRINDCSQPADRVCRLAAESSVPINVVSFALAPSHRSELACLAEVSGGVFVHLTDGREADNLINSVVRAALMRAEMTRLEQLSLQLANDIDHLSQSLDFEIRENADLRDENTKLAAENGALMEKNADLEAHVDELKAALKIANEKIINLEVALAECLEKLRNAEKQAEVLEEHLVKALAERDDLHDRLIEVSELKAELDTELELCLARESEAQNRIVELRASVESLKSTVVLATDNCEGRVAAKQLQHEAEVKKLEALIADIKGKLALANEALEKALGRIEELTAEVDRLGEENSYLTAVAAGLEEAIAHLSTELSAAERVNHELREQLEQCPHWLDSAIIEESTKLKMVNRKLMQQVAVCARAIEDLDGVLYDHGQFFAPRKPHSHAFGDHRLFPYIIPLEDGEGVAPEDESQ